MKKIVYLLSFFVFTFVVVPAFAQTPTTKPNGEVFRMKLQTIRDEKKKAIVEQIDQKIKELNTNRTNIMLRQLVKIEEILGHVETRANAGAASGKDISTVQTAITKAKEAIASARTAVITQAGKTYTIDITTEQKLGQAVSTVRTAFAKDLGTSHQTVVTARKAVRDVLTALAKTVGEKLTSTIEK